MDLSCIPIRRVIFGAVLLIGSVLAACSSDSTDGLSQQGSDGTRLGSNRYELDGLPYLRVIEEMRIGSTDDPEIGFAIVSGMDVDVDKNGNIFVLDGQSLELRKYNATGELVWAMGGRGDGPGEFRVAPTIGVVGDTIWAHDRLLRRIALFSQDGEVLSAKRYPQIVQALHPTSPVRGVEVASMNGILLPFAMRQDGHFISVMEDSFVAPPDGRLPGIHDTIQIPRLAFDASGAVVDTLGWETRFPEEPVTASLLEVGEVQFIVPMASPELVPEIWTGV